jgi:hypothetical protein
MQLRFALLIVAILGGAAHGQPGGDAREVFHCDFGADWDANFDEWPDRWTRQSGPGYPSYLEIGIRPDADAAASRCLTIELDGGAAAVFSPPIPIDPRFSYRLEARLKTRGLRHDRAFLSVTFYDADQRKLETVYSQRRRDAPDWASLEIGPFAARDMDARTAVVGLHLTPTERQDLRGAASFGDLRLMRQPRITLACDGRHNLYADPQNARVTCALSGVVDPAPTLRFELLDAAGRTVAETTQTLKGEPMPPASPPSIPAGDARAPTSTYACETEGRPPLDSHDYGFFRARVSMLGPDGDVHYAREITLAVLRPLSRPSRGEFGWTLSDGERPLALDALLELLPKTGIHWLKFPVWYGEQDTKRGDQLAAFAEQLDAQGVELVGLVARPPKEVLKGLPEFKSAFAANIFSADPSIWFPSIDAALARLSFNIQWWQLGGDRDASFVGYPDLPKKIAELKSKLFRFGQEAHLGIGWREATEPPAANEPPWDFLAYASEPPPTSQSRERGKPASDSPSPERLKHGKGGPVKRWVLVEPLPRGASAAEARARDLVEQMIAAKIAGAEGVFLPSPFSTERGVMNDDGTPGELLPPWRAAALALGGAKYLGEIQLPRGSRNHVFSRDGQAVMVVWNERPAREVLYLGEDVRQLDLSGRVTALESQTDADGRRRQVVEVGPMPTFLLGVNLPVARWRRAAKFERDRMPSVPGEAHSNALRLKNTFDEAVVGQVALVAPEDWSVAPRETNFELNAGETRDAPFEIKLPLTAGGGMHPVRIDFDLTADRRYRFSVYRELGVGSEDLEIEIATHLAGDGSLIVEQRATNRGATPVSFKCALHAPGRRVQNQYIRDLSAGEDVQTYRYPNGRELVGQRLWLRAEETRGPRILNYRYTARE